MKPASELTQARDYPNFPEFERFRIPLDKLEARLILEIQQMRRECGVALTPSPVIAGWARESGSPNSQHYAVGRLSTAGDLFPARGSAMTAWLHAIGAPAFGGVGIYNDTRGPDGNPWVMIHVDLRPERLWWVRDNGRYIYHTATPQGFWRAVKALVDREVADGPASGT